MTEPFKRMVKAVLPTSILIALQRARADWRSRGKPSLSIPDAFDHIYEQGIWAAQPGQLSGSGSYGAWATEYVNFVRRFIRENNINSIVDVGCGDFNVGSQICGEVEHYTAMDVSGYIITKNRDRFADYSNVDFVHADACQVSIPKADLVTIRQILQHLTNTQIEQILRNVESSGAQFAIIAEHVPSQRTLKKPNVDTRTHSQDIRTQFGSGVFIEHPPFSRTNARVVMEITGSKDELNIGVDDVLRVYVYKLPSENAAGLGKMS